MKLSLGRAALALTLACTMVLCSCTVDQVLSDIDVALEIAQNLAPAVGTVLPADGLIIAGLSGIAIKGVTAIKKTYDDAQAGKPPTGGLAATIQSIATSLKQNLAADLAAAHVSNPDLLTKITNWCNLLYSMLTALLAKLSGAVSARFDTSAAVMTPETLQARWQTEVCQGDAKCGSLVKVKHAHIHRGFWAGIGEWKFGG